MVSLGDSIEHLADSSEISALSVQIHECVRDGDGVGSVSEFIHVRVDLLPQIRVVEVGDGLQQSGEGEIVGRYAGDDHVDVSGDGFAEEV